jgi:hypothetical protein
MALEGFNKFFCRRAYDPALEPYFGGRNDEIDDNQFISFAVLQLCTFHAWRSVCYQVLCYPVKCEGSGRQVPHHF